MIRRINKKETTNSNPNSDSNLSEDKKLTPYEIKNEILFLGYDPQHPFVKRVLEKLDKNHNSLSYRSYKGLMNELENKGRLPLQPNNDPESDPYYDWEIVPFPPRFGVPLNEDAIQELIKKEEENLVKKENDKTKSLDEIKNNLNSLNSYFNDTNKNIYKDSYYSDLKKNINK